MNRNLYGILIPPTMTGINNKEDRREGLWVLFKEMLTTKLFKIKIKSEKQRIQPLLPNISEMLL